MNQRDKYAPSAPPVEKESLYPNLEDLQDSYYYPEPSAPPIEEEIGFAVPAYYPPFNPEYSPHVSSAQQDPEPYYPENSYVPEVQEYKFTVYDKNKANDEEDKRQLHKLRQIEYDLYRIEQKYEKIYGNFKTASKLNNDEKYNDFFQTITKQPKETNKVNSILKAVNSLGSTFLISEDRSKLDEFVKNSNIAVLDNRTTELLNKVETLVNNIKAAEHCQSKKSQYIASRIGEGLGEADYFGPALNLIDNFMSFSKREGEENKSVSLIQDRQISFMRESVDRMDRDLNKIKTNIDNIFLSEAAYQNPENIKFMLDIGANIDIHNSKALNLVWNDEECFDLLLSRGINVNNKWNFFTANTSMFLEDAVNDSNASKAAKLINHGAKIPVKNYYEKQLIHMAAESGNVSLVSALLEAGADIDSIQKAELSVGAWLWDCGISIASMVAYPFTWIAGSESLWERYSYEGRKIGTTPLHIAASRNDFAMSEFLKAHGANISIKDESGKLASDYIKEDSLDETTEFPSLTVEEQLSYRGNTYHYDMQHFPFDGHYPKGFNYRHFGENNTVEMAGAEVQEHEKV